MSASPPTILLLDEEDTCIAEHTAVIEKVKYVKEEWQRQQEEEAWRETKAKEAKNAQAEEAKQKKAEASTVWRKQLEQLSQCKVAVRIAWEEETQRALKAGAVALGSRILGYRKGKAPEKQVCANCLHKGIECEWDKGG